VRVVRGSLYQKGFGYAGDPRTTLLDPKRYPAQEIVFFFCYIQAYLQ